MKKFRISEYVKLEDMTGYELTPKWAILAKCKECSGFYPNEARLCTCRTCALYPLKEKYYKNPTLGSDDVDEPNAEED